MTALAQSPIPPRRTQWTARDTIGATVCVLAIGAVFWAAWRFHYALFMVLAAIMLRVIIRPAVDALRAKGLRHEISVWLVFSAVAVAIGAAMIIVVPLMIDQAGAFAARLPERYTDLRSQLITQPAGVIQNVGRAMPAAWTQAWALIMPDQMTPQTAASAPSDADTDGTAGALAWISGLGYGAFLLIAIVMMAAYWTLDAERVMRALLLRIPEARRDETRALITEMEAEVGGYFRGQLLLCAAIFVLSTLAYTIIGLPNALLLGAIAGIFEALPMIGPLLGMLPALFVALSTSPEQALWVLAAGIVIQQLENIVLVPRVMDRTVGINPLVSILALTAFSYLFGIAGALFAIPIAAILQIVTDRVLGRSHAEVPGSSMEPHSIASGGRGVFSALRMEARELAEDARKQMRVEHAASPQDQLSAESDRPHLEDEIELIALDLDELLTSAGNLERAPLRASGAA